jgi:protein TonB
LRWGGCLLLVLLAHAAGAASILDWSKPVPPMQLPPPAIMIDLGAAQPAPPPPPRQPAIEPPRPIPPTPPAPEMPKVEVPQVKSEVALEQRKPEKPRLEQKKKRKEKPKPAEKPPLPTPPQSVAKAPETPTVAPAKPVEQGQIQDASTTAAKAQESAASAAASAVAMKNWESLVAAHLIKHKRSQRMRHRQPMTAYVHVAINRQGQILARNVMQSSGDERLDQAALDLIDRANPLPPPPADYADGRLQSINLPVVFTPR